MEKMKVVCIDMDGVLCDYDNSWRDGIGRHPDQPFPQSEFGFFSNLRPYPGAIESFRELDQHFKVYILTRPSNRNLSSYSEKAGWVRDKLGEHVLENLILCCDKSMVKGDYLIDDMTAHGQSEFEGEHIHFGRGKFPDWKSVMNYLEPEMYVKA